MITHCEESKQQTVLLHQTYSCLTYHLPTAATNTDITLRTRPTTLISTIFQGGHRGALLQQAFLDLHIATRRHENYVFPISH